MRIAIPVDEKNIDSEVCISFGRTPYFLIYDTENGNEEILEYIGIAFDELSRVKEDKNLKYPLVEWKITEKQALEYCYNKGFKWNGLYEKFDRVSCWACPLQPLKSLRVLYKDFPKLWEKLKEWDNKARRSFKPNFSIEQLEERFKEEK